MTVNQKPDAMVEKISSYLADYAFRLHYHWNDLPESEAQSLLDLILPELKAQLQKEGWKSPEDVAKDRDFFHTCLSDAVADKLNQIHNDLLVKLKESIYSSPVKQKLMDELNRYFDALKSDQLQGEVG